MFKYKVILKKKESAKCNLHCSHTIRLVKILPLKQGELQHHPLSLDVSKKQMGPVNTICLLKKKLYLVEFQLFVSLWQYGFLCIMYLIWSMTNKFMSLRCSCKNLCLAFQPQKLKNHLPTLQFLVTFSRLLQPSRCATKSFCITVMHLYYIHNHASPFAI